jgi:hypothetical protein
MAKKRSLGKVVLDKHLYADEKTEQESAVDKIGTISTFSVSATGKTGELIRNLPATFSGALAMLMEWRGMTVEQLAEKSLVSPKTIQRMRTNIHYKFEMGTVIAVCIGLNLPCYVSTELVKKAGLAFKPTDEHVAYQHLLTEYCGRTIQDCNEALAFAGFPPIGRGA